MFTGEKMKLLKFVYLGLFVFVSFGFGQEKKENKKKSLNDLMNTEISVVSKASEKNLTSPAVVNVITQDMIRAYGYRTLYDALRHTPGFWAIQDVNDKLMGMRGVHASVNQKFLLLINGKRLTENLWNLTDIDYNISLTNVNRIEIMRGPGSVAYGRAALTGVINVVTFSGEVMDGGSMHLSLGSYGYLNFGYNYGAKTSRGDQIEVLVHGVSVGGQEFALSAAEDGAVNRISGKEIVDKYKFPTGGLIARFSNKDWEFNLVVQSREYQQPRGAGAQLVWQDTMNNDYWSTIYGDRLMGEKHLYLVFDVDRKFWIGNIKNVITFNYTFSRVGLFENPKPYRDMTFPANWDDTDKKEYGLGELFNLNIESYRVGVEYSGQYDLKKTRILWGGEIYQTVPTKDQFQSNFTSTIVLDQLIKIPIEGGYFREKPNGTFDALRKEWLYSAYGEVKTPLFRNLWLNLGARYDMHVKGDDYQQSSEKDRYPDPEAEEKRRGIEKRTSQVSPRVAFIFQPMSNDRLTFKAIYSKSFIAPGYFYRYADPSTSYAGGPWLEAETLDSYIMACESILGNFGIKAQVFLNINKNLLTRDLSLVPARYTSLGKLGMQGLEIDLYYQKNFLTTFANFSYLTGIEDLTDDVSEQSWIMDDNSIKNFPKYFGSFGVSGIFFDDKMNAGVSGLWHGGIKSPVGAGENAGTVEDINSVFQFDLNLRYRLKRLGGMEVGLTIFNVMNEKIRLGGTVRMPYNQAGRWIVFSLLKQF